MKALLTFFAVVLFSSLAHANGVERGDINVSANDGIPKGVEDRIETTMFESCDLRGASSISTSYFQFKQLEGANEYEIQYAVDFGSQGRTVMINVRAVLQLSGGAESAVQIASFDSPICRKIP